MPDPANAARATVLAVDDEPGVRDALRLVLDDTYDVLQASNGDRALDLLTTNRVDVILLDLLIPDVHGLELLPRLHAVDPTVVVLVLTALATAATVVRAMKLGAWGYVTKPWEDDHLRQTVRDAAVQRRVSPGVLLISNDVAALAPLQLLLERYVRVCTTALGKAAACRFPAKVVVMQPAGRSAEADARWVRTNFPGCSMIVLRDAPERVDHLAIEVLKSAGIPRIALASSEPVANAIAFMAGHYAKPLVVGDVARAAALSEDRFAHVFKQTTGFPVKDYLTRLRIAIARRLLTETEAKLDVIARRVGLVDGSRLSRTFIDVAGLRPGKFRRSVGQAGDDVRADELPASISLK